VLGCPLRGRIETTKPRFLRDWRGGILVVVEKTAGS
jgi:hypothetical protein